MKTRAKVQPQAPRPSGAEGARAKAAPTSLPEAPAPRSSPTWTGTPTRTTDAFAPAASTAARPPPAWGPELVAHAGPESMRQVLTAWQGMPGWQRLTPAEQDTATRLSRNAAGWLTQQETWRNALLLAGYTMDGVRTPGGYLATMEPDAQASVIRSTLDNLQAPPPVEPKFSREPALVGGSRLVTAPPGLAVSGPARQTVVQFPTQRVNVPVFEAAAGSPWPPGSLKHLTEAMAMLPPELRARLHTVTLAPAANPDDAYWAQAYGIPGFTSAATCGAEGDVTFYPASLNDSPAALRDTLMHELGHATSMTAWGTDAADARWSPWKAAAKKDGRVPSDYASVSPFEDYAEAVRTAEVAHASGPEAWARYQAQFPGRVALLKGSFPSLQR